MENSVGTVSNACAPLPVYSRLHTQSPAFAECSFRFYEPSRLKHLGSDYASGLRKIEASVKLKYIKRGFHLTPDVETYYSALDIPELGQASSGYVAASDTYLVFPADTEVFVETVPQSEGGILYMVEIHDNPAALWWQPGGWYAGKYLIGGNIVALPSTLGATHLYRPFVRAVTHGFVAVPDPFKEKWAVGPEAMKLLYSGIPLVIRKVDEPESIGILKPPDYLSK